MPYAQSLPISIMTKEKWYYGHDPKKMRVYEIMTKPCIAVNPDLGVEYVARLFANTRLRRAPVVGSKLLGIVSVSDILRKSDFVEKPKSSFELYCEENPGALEARIYED